MKRSLIALIALALAGCGTLQNRITVTLPCDRAFMASLYGPIGLTSEIAAEDVAVLCGRAAK
jgi:hypothetical protein